MAFSPDHRVALGKSGLFVSPICFGTSGLGDMPETYGYGVSAERAYDTINAIFDSPVNFMDSSRNYGTGRSEERIGHVIRERGGLPKGFVISTKLDRDFKTNQFDASRARRSLEESMKALGVDVLFKTLEVFGIDAKGEPQEAFFVALDDPGIALRVVEGVNGQTVTVVFDFQAKVGVKRPGVFQVGHTQDVLVE